MLKSLINLFFVEYEEEVEETFYRFKTKVNSSNIRIPKKDSLLNTLEKIPSRDDFIIDLIIEDSDPYRISIDNIDDDLEKIQHTLSLEDDVKEVKMNISITKYIDKNMLSVYSFHNFCQYLFDLDLIYLLNDFNELLINNEKVYFETFDASIVSWTQPS